jgi:hypothetical protein
MSRRTIITLAAMATLAFAIIAPTASASNQPNLTVSNGSYVLSVDNNVTIHKTAPNLQFTVTTANSTASDATCQVYVRELGYWTSSYTVMAGKSVTTGFGAPFPTTKLSTLTYDLWCNDSLQVTAASKVVTTDHVG